MKHLGNGELRAYLDGELSDSQKKLASTHVKSCEICNKRAEEIGSLAEISKERLDKLQPSSIEVPVSTKEAYARYKSKMREKRRISWWSNLFSRRYRPVLAGLSAAAILLAVLFIPQVQTMAVSFLGLFRVEQISVVQVDPGNLPEQLSSASQFEQILAQDVQFETAGEEKEAASIVQARTAAGIPVRLPTYLGDDYKLMVAPQSIATIKVDIEKIQALLNEIDFSEIQIPDSLDGETVTIDVPSSVKAVYGSCQSDSLSHDYAKSVEAEHESNLDFDGCTTLVQMSNPTVSAPPGLNIAQIGEAFLQVMGMSAEEAAHFSENIDWATTLVIPIPMDVATYTDVFVDGVDGTLIQADSGHYPYPYLLIWVKEDVIYALFGTGSTRTALRIASSMQ